MLPIHSTKKSKEMILQCGCARIVGMNQRWIFEKGEFRMKSFILSAYLIWCFGMIPVCIIAALWIGGTRKRLFMPADFVWLGFGLTAGLVCTEKIGLADPSWWATWSSSIFTLNVLFMWKCLSQVKEKDVENVVWFACTFVTVYGSVLSALVVDCCLLTNKFPFPFEWQTWSLWLPYFVFGNFFLLGMLSMGIFASFVGPEEFKKFMESSDV
jgi:hypothetical protein